MSTTTEIRSIVLRWEMFVTKYSLPGKNNFNPAQIMTKSILELQKSHSKILQPHQILYP